ncbi:unnamed protein product, partial [Musa hybrid cultivar]
HLQQPTTLFTHNLIIIAHPFGSTTTTTTTTSTAISTSVTCLCNLSGVSSNATTKSSSMDFSDPTALSPPPKEGPEPEQ